jgi:hypothetical protein
MFSETDSADNLLSLALPPLTSALDGDEWSAARFGRFTHKDKAPCIHWTGGWMSLKGALDAIVHLIKLKSSFLCLL